MKNKAPLARYENIVVQELMDEVLVCDLEGNQVFCLNHTASEVWKLCNGHNSAKAISQILTERFNKTIAEELVLFSLNELSTHNLLIRKLPEKEILNGLSRREIIKRIGLGSMVALPIISSVVMPTAAQSQTGCPPTNAPQGCPCTSPVQCDAGAGLICCAPSNPVCNPGC